MSDKEEAQAAPAQEAEDTASTEEAAVHDDSGDKKEENEKHDEVDHKDHNEEEEEEEEGTSEDDDDVESSDDDQIKVSLTDNITQAAAVEAAKRRFYTQAHSTPSGNFAAMRTPGEIFSNGNRIPWDLVNPMGVHPTDPTKSIFSYDLSELPNNVQEKPWTAPDVDITDWFNYGFNEETWEKYRRKISKVIKNEKYESKISVLAAKK